MSSGTAFIMFSSPDICETARQKVLALQNTKTKFWNKHLNL